MRGTIIFLTLLLACLPNLAQTSARNDELKFDADYFLMRKEFDKALDLYLNVLRSEPDNADIKHRIGICYLNSEDEKEKAIPYLEEATKMVSTKYNINSFKETNAPVEAYFLLGSAYRVNNKLDEAISAYEKYKEFLNPKDKYNLEVTDQYINNCKLAREMMKEPRPVTFSNLGKVINTSQPNFNAVVSGDGKTLAYTTPGRQGFLIYLCSKTDTTWSTPKDITSMLGTGKYMKTCSLSQDGNTMLLVQEDPENSDLFISQFKKGRWSKVVALKKPINSKGNETHASLSPNGKTMYFTSVRKGGEGDLDIYRSTLQGEEWSKPENLGPMINTPYNEETPFISPDGHLLYFSSEGHSGMGGYDVFRYDFDHPEEGVVNLGYPINTTDNNLFYVPTGDGSTAFYSFCGQDSQGGRDIYEVKILPVNKEEAPMATLPAPVDEVKKEILVVNASAEPELKTETPVTEPAQEMKAAVAGEQKDTLTAIAEIEKKPEIIPEDQSEREKATETPDHSEVIPAEARSYSVQFMALRKPVDLLYFNGLTDIAVGYRPDAWYRYSWRTTTDSLRAHEILKNLVSKGYTDAFIRKKSIIPRYTVQVMAVPGPVTDLTRFSDLPEISVVKGNDRFCRYTTGEFEDKDEALAALKKIKLLGYNRAFVRKVRTLQ
jgi:Tol biopolymer transport system component